MDRRVAALAWLLALPVPLHARGLDTLEEIRQCVRDNAPDQSSVQSFDVTTVDRVGSERHLGAKMLWKRFPNGLSKIVIRLSRPPAIRGSAYLLIEKPGRSDMFVYLPALQKVRRISVRAASGSLFGTDFSYEDIDHLQKVASSSSARQLSDAEVEGRPSYVIATEPSSDYRSAYRSIHFYIDQETCSLLRTDYFGHGGQLRKRLSVDPRTLVLEGHTWVPRRFSVQDLVDETWTHVALEKISIDERISDSLFSESALMRRR